MAHKKLKPIIDPAVIQLAEAYAKGTDCRDALHDALLEAGAERLAKHFVDNTTCQPGQACAVLTFLQQPGLFVVDFLEECRLCLEAHLAGASQIVAGYAGSGDSGSIDDISVSAIGKPGVRPGKWVENHRDGIENMVDARLPGGWEINEGSHGTATLDCRSLELVIEHTNQGEEVVAGNDEDEEEQEYQTVDLETEISTYEIAHVQRIESDIAGFEKALASNLGPGYVERIEASDIPFYMIHEPGTAERALPRRITWMLLTEGRLYDPHHLFEGVLAEAVRAALKQ